MSDDDLQQLIVRELRAFFKPLIAAADSPSAVAELLVQAGWDPAAVPVANSLQATFNAVENGVGAIERSPETLPEVIAFVNEIRLLIDNVRDMPEDFRAFLQTLTPAPDVGEVAGDLLTYLTTRYVRRRSPIAYWSLVALDIVRGPPVRSWAVDGQGYPVRMGPRQPRIDPDSLLSFIEHPLAHLAAAYVSPGGLQVAGDARTMSDKLCPRVVPLLAHVGARAEYVQGDETVLDPITARRARSLQVRLGDSGVGANIAILARDEGGPGVSIEPAGSWQAAITRGRWLLTAAVEGNLPSLDITESGIDLGGSEHVRVDVSAARLADPATYAAFTIGSKTGTRLELGLLELLAFLDSRTADYGFGFDAQDSAIVLQSSDGDGLLQKILPPEGLRAGFTFGIAWSKDRGLRVSGAAGIEVDISLGASVGGVIDLDSLYLALRGEMQRVSVAFGVSFAVYLGPIVGTVDRVGLQASFGWSGADGFSLGFLPPTGAGLAIDSGVTGGGFLEFDEENQRYAGILALKLGDIGLTAVGLITTELPDGSDGFSMLVNIGVTFDPPIQLSMGFTLSGVGGLVGVHRSMMIDVLREGVKKGTLDSILFPEPEWVIPNAAKVISDLRSVFPPTEGRFVIGPMVKIGYGSPNFILADVGIFLEVPEPVRVVLLGQLAMELPDPDEVVARINLDMVGVVDVEKKELTFQASLYDSAILTYDLVGDSAFSLSWGEQPEFALSLGGFHPRFTPPPPPIVFSGLRRLSLNLSRGSSFQLSCGVYQALTPNSLQFGARAELVASESGAEVTGQLSFDTLIYFSPFSFEVDLGAAVNIRYQGASLADIRLALVLSGPTPWNARGKASIKLLFYDLEVAFQRTWGREKVGRVDPVDPWPRLEAALRRAESWGSRLPEGTSLVESFREIEPDPPDMEAGEEPPPNPVVVHPAGMVEIRQSVAPLETTLEKFGSAPISGHDRFRIATITTADDVELDTAPVDEFFARAQFEALSNSRRLSVPAFEKMPGGVTTKASGHLKVQSEVRRRAAEDVASSILPAREAKLRYESIVIGADRTSHTLETPGQEEQATTQWETTRFTAAGNAARRSALRRAGNARFAHTGPGMVGTHEEKYAVADADTLDRATLDSRVDAPSEGMTRMQADRALADHLALHPEDGEALMVVAEYELEAA